MACSRGGVRHDSFAPIGGPPTIRSGVVAEDGLYVVDEEHRRLARYANGQWAELSDVVGFGKRFPSAITLDRASDTMLLSDEGGRLWCRAPGRDWGPLPRSIRPGAKDPPWLRVANQSYFATAQLRFDPVHPGRLWVAAGTGVWVAERADRCRPVAWESQSRGIEELVANDVLSLPGHAPLFAAWDFGIHRKPDLDRFSTGYGPRERVLIAAQQLAASARHPAFVVTNASDTRTFCCSEDGQAVLAGYSEDGGRSWTRFATLPTPPGTSASDPWRMAFGTIAVAADNPDNIVWMPAHNRAPFYTLDRGESWRKVVLPGEIGPATGSFTDYYLQRKTLVADPVAPGTFYLLHAPVPRRSSARAWC